MNNESGITVHISGDILTLSTPNGSYEYAVEGLVRADLIGFLAVTISRGFKGADRRMRGPEMAIIRQAVKDVLPKPIREQMTRLTHEEI